jgi:flagellar hook assembly protein FlgD
MKKLLIPFFILFAYAAAAQFNNSWIDYSKTYYKFKISADGMYHINQPLLVAAGLGSVPAEQFKLWRNGQEVRLYTSLATGIMGANDYIEFWGKKNDGVIDKPLYFNPNSQLCDSFSLFTDTATYFLTYTSSGSNLRYASGINDIAGNILPADAYFMRHVAMPYNTFQSLGNTIIAGGDALYSAEYDKGEGWGTYPFGKCCPAIQEFDGLNVYTAGPANSLSCYVAAFARSSTVRNVQIKIFNNVILDSQVIYYDTVKSEKDNLPLSYLQNPNFAQVTVRISSTFDSINDNITLALISLTYPATFNFNGAKNFAFELQPSASGNYLVINNFNIGSSLPALYDEQNGIRYLGDTTVAGQVRFALPASVGAIRSFKLVNEDISNSTNITSLTPKTFIDFSNATNQGDYLIISNPVLYDDGYGHNYVEDYRAYRASIAGGSYNAKVIDIHELDDQFAFGVKKDPEAIRNLIAYSQTWPVKPKYVFIIGRGVTSWEYRAAESDPTIDKLDLVQTFGTPASDILLSATPGTIIPRVPIGRLPAINGTEVAILLQKMEDYEAAQSSGIQTIENKGWMKNFIHIVGASDSAENVTFSGYMNRYKSIAQDTLYGANVSTFTKQSSNAVVQANSTVIRQLIKGGVAFIGYFGHAAASTLAYHLDDPSDYQNQHKYYFFNVAGCSSGNFYSYDITRLQGNMTISENFELAKDHGSIGFLAGTASQLANYIDTYNGVLYKNICQTMYGNSIGNQMQQILRTLGSNPSFPMRLTLEEVALDGDPAMKIYYDTLADYVIEDQYVKISPSIISVADNSFNVNVSWFNIGKAIHDSIWVNISRKLPNGTIQPLYNKKILATKSIDSVNLVVNINGATDVGINHIIVTLDTSQEVNELSELNNTVDKTFQIYQDELNPVFPYNYSIVNAPGIIYSASTANAVSGQRQYMMEIDTTAQFNSSFMKQYNVSGVGGIVQFSPSNIVYKDSTVYYWRTAIVPVGTEPLIWNGFSFLYLTTGGTGFNQSHYYQHLQSSDSDIVLDSDRIFQFAPFPENLTINTGLAPYYTYDRINISTNNNIIEDYSCHSNSLQFLVYDTLTLDPWKNPVNPVQGKYGSASVCSSGGSFRYFFEFPYGTPSFRKAAMDFIDSIPSGKYVSITNFGATSNTSFISDWQSDTASLGSGNDLYDKLKSIGFTQIDSFTRNLPFIFFFKKNSSTYTPIQLVGPDPTSNTSLNITLNSKVTSGSVQSPLFGPAKTWQSLHWNGTSIEPVSTDSVQIQVYGVKNDGTKVLLKTIPSTVTDTSLASINAATYPYLQLKMLATDVVYATPEQLSYWRVNGDYVPEGAVAPNILYAMQDTVTQGQNINFSMAFKNISAVAFDSLSTLFTITDHNNVTHTIPIPKGKALISGDTMTVNYTINTMNYSGNNTLYVMVNPNNDQPEQYLYNNFIYKNFYVKQDQTDPVMDVTFDGVHILNRDIVSAKPHILIKLTDENKFLALTDTSMLSVFIRYPGQATPVRYYYGDSLIFTPANLATGVNVASIELSPTCSADGEYTLIVSGKDAQGNPTGNLQYEVAFKVTNKSMISNLLNYPNPFTTSTAFVFTLTGSETPQNMRIEILTITGKVVREITPEELGPIHVGVNITQFKWDGTDTYGQRLGNGVYLYRVITNLNGKAIDKYDVPNINQYFTSGYGKMYLMR